MDVALVQFCSFVDDLKKTRLVILFQSRLSGADWTPQLHGLYFAVQPGASICIQPQQVTRSQ